MYRNFAAVLVTLAGLAAIVPAAQAATAQVRVVVTGTPGSGQAAVAAVRHADGRVIGRVTIINGVVARVPVRSLGGIRRSPGVRSVNADRHSG